MQDISTDHILAPIRRLRAEISNLFTTRESVHSQYKCTNVHCPNNVINEKFVFKDRNFGKHSQQSRKAAVGRSNSSSVLKTIQTKTQGSYPHKVTEARSPKQKGSSSHQKTVLKSSLSLHQQIQPPKLTQQHLLPRGQLIRRHSDMTVLKRPEETWQSRARSSFLNTDTAEDDTENHNEVARTMWRKQIQRRRTVPSSRHHRASPVNEDLSSLLSSNNSVEDHIYEEIKDLPSDSDDSESETEDNSFLTLISSGRRHNLLYYGGTGWDFGAEVS